MLKIDLSKLDFCLSSTLSYLCNTIILVDSQIKESKCDNTLEFFRVKQQKRDLHMMCDMFDHLTTCIEEVDSSLKERYDEVYSITKRIKEEDNVV